MIKQESRLWFLSLRSKLGSSVRISLFSGGERETERAGTGPEVLGGLGGDVGEELHLDAAGRNGADGDVEENDGVLGVGWPLVPLHRHRRRRSRRSNQSVAISAVGIIVRSSPRSHCEDRERERALASCYR